jgi:hypothetical protein
MITKTRHGIAPCRGIAEVFELEDFLLIFGPAIGWVGPSYFLNKLSKAARASSALRGAGITPLPGVCDNVPVGAESRATVTRGENSSHVFA